MSRLKTFLIYILMIVAFWILSNILIYYGINSTYNNIKRQGELPSQVTINEAEATTVNGRIKGTIRNSEENNLSNKYLKINLYSSIGNLLGTKYLEIGELGTNETKNIETYFKIQEVKAYSISIVDQKEELESGEFTTEDITKLRVLMLLTYMIFA